MSMGFRADPTNTSGVITVAGVDQVVVTNASNVVATTFTGALAGNASTATALSTATGAAPSYGARAWVNFDGTRDTSGAVSTANTNRLIRQSGNVGSVLRNALGNYTINFATPMIDINYTAIGTVGELDNVAEFSSTVNVNGPYTTSSLRIATGFTTPTSDQLDDRNVVNVVIFR